ncbi:MAG: hypothetical protein QG655_3116 [Actinomycetota bacterium]|nr:hypothetical protein [Actinomycetota bacterium]
MTRDHPLSAIREVTRGLGRLDRAVFEAVADSPSPLLDRAMPALTRAADHSKLWIVLAAVLSQGPPSTRRGAVRGLTSLAATSLLTNQVAKRLRRRARPDGGSVPLARRARRLPTSNSLPSGHAASAAAFAVGVGLESPGLGIGLALLAGLVGLSRVATGAHYPGDVVAGFGLGAAVAVLGGRIVPPVVPAQLPRTSALRVTAPERPDGSGVILVVNPASGGGAGTDVIDGVRSALPAMEIVTLGPDDDGPESLRSAAGRAEVLAVAGGDGTVGCAAGVAVAQGIPLAVFPAGTFNHFAKDIGCDNVGATVEAIRTGSVWCVDIVKLDEEQTVVNTASIGAYPHYVATREKWEHKVGKAAAGLYAMIHTLRHGQPVRISYDGNTVTTSLFFLGNSVYLPSGFAPARRTRMDDGLMDVRILESGRPYSRLRIMTSLVLGRLERSPLYHELQVPEFSFTAVDGPIAVARDGEVDSPRTSARFTNVYRALQVYRPAP